MRHEYESCRTSIAPFGLCWTQRKGLNQGLENGFRLTIDEGKYFVECHSTLILKKIIHKYKKFIRRLPQFQTL